MQVDNTRWKLCYRDKEQANTFYKMKKIFYNKPLSLKLDKELACDVEQISIYGC